MVIQMIFIGQSVFSLHLYSYFGGKLPSFDPLSLIPLIVVIGSFVLLSVRKVQNSITKRMLLIILFSLALVTILSRQILPSSFEPGLKKIGPRDLVPKLSTFRWEWGMVFFLIIPLVFIAWQFTMREVVLYCVMIVAAEGILLFFPGQVHDPFFTIMNFFSDIIRSLAFGFVGWIENRLVTVQREQQAQLVKANRKLRDYARTSEKLAQTQERNRLARELHDTLAHTLSSVSVQLEATKALFDRDTEKARDMLEESIANTRSGLKETRRTLFDLRASELETFGLVQSIRNLGESAAERAGFEIHLDLDEKLDVLPEDIGHCLYRTTQEALENIVRHAGAEKVSVMMAGKDARISLRIKDDGAGFNPDAVADENLGLRGMRERVEMLGGEFSISSQPDKGTTLNATLKRDDD